MIFPIIILPISFYINRQNCHVPGRVSFRIPNKRTKKISWNGSITIEAALVIPLFFLAVVSLYYMMEVMAVRTSIRNGMQYAGKKAAEQAYTNKILMPGNLERDIVEAVGTERLERSIVKGGSGGIHCEQSRMSARTGILDLHVSYQVFLPIPAFHSAAVPMEESCRMKGWSGYERTGFHETDEDTVYITENGMVYHRDYHCTYLDLSIRVVSGKEVEELRNKSDGKYYPCEHCGGKGPVGEVYITDYGDRYHSSVNCSGLKRTIYAVPLSEAVGKGACSKCG